MARYNLQLYMCAQMNQRARFASAERISVTEPVKARKLLSSNARTVRAAIVKVPGRNLIECSVSGRIHSIFLRACLQARIIIKKNERVEHCDLYLFEVRKEGKGSQCGPQAQ